MTKLTPVIFLLTFSLSADDMVVSEVNVVEYVLIVVILIVIVFIMVFINTRLRSALKSGKKLEHKLQKHFDLMDDNIIVSTTDLDGKIIDVSSAFCRVSGYTREELIGQTHSIVRAMGNEVYKELWDSITQDKTFSGEIKNQAKDGSFFWVNIFVAPVFDEKGKKIAYTAIRQDITNRKKLESISITDELTSIHNRRYFNKILPKLINSAKREYENISFVMMDIDSFKLYNDIYGHHAGDEALKKIAAVLSISLQRADDYYFRLGGEEFGILFKGLSEHEAKELIEKIRKNIEDLHIKHENSGVSKYVTASFGLVYKKAELIQDTQELYQEADRLLYRAKAGGRNRVVSNI
ncbi:diguanylate cyclase [bacterium]|nr:diguanylate cyclase [bacterium]MBU1993352.1 diguanylate cyclase [bacterium]